MKKTAPLFSFCTVLLVAGISIVPSQAQVPAKAPYMDTSLPTEKRIDDLMSRLTLEEKLEMVHGNGKFRSGGVPRLGIPYLWTADGPQGVREEGQLHTWEPIGATNDFATAMPVGMSLASSFNQDLAVAYGKVIGEEARQREKHVMLGPALNIMRTPLCGRNYDYFGEDPWLAGRMTVGYVKGMQGEQVVACIKHFALNNQEFMRWMINVEVEERPLREIYLSAFEAGVKEGGALSVMGAYNKFRGAYCCENDLLLNQILKKEWGFQGGVISDWGGTHDTEGAALGGLDLEMGTRGTYDKYYLSNPFKEGLKSGKYPMALLDDKVRRNLRMLYFSGAVDGRRPGSINTAEHLTVARQIATEGGVLLKNSQGLLPVDPTKYKTIAVIGENAVLKYAAGHGAAGVKAFREVTALEGILARVGTQATVQYSAGYRHPNISWKNMRDVAGVRSSELTAATPEEEKGLRERAIRAAKESDLVIYVGGLCHQTFQDDEGMDRKDLSLPARQDDLISELVNANPRTVVVLISGSPVNMPWLDKVPALMQFWYGGSEGGNALAALLFGDANPSGKLPCTFPKQLKDSPAHFTGSAINFPGEKGTVRYDEGLLVGYRWFDTKKIEPLFPFGFGLSYTTFSYANLKVTSSGGASATVECEITNTGAREGAEVAQVYLQPKNPSVQRPMKELKGFAKVSLKPGETKKVSIALNGRSFAYYAPDKKGWVAEAGEYGVLVGASSRDIKLTGNIKLAKTEQVQ